MNTEALTIVDYKNIRIELNNDTSPVAICYSIYNNKIFVGTVSVLVSDNNYLKEIFIEKLYRQKGLGRYLIALFDIKKLNCTTWNTIGIIFYKSLGFIETERDVYLITFERKNKNYE